MHPSIRRTAPMLFLTFVLAAVVVAVAASAAGDGDQPPAAADAEVRLHLDTAALERAVLDTTLAFLREDTAAARKSLDVVAGSTRRLAPEERETFGSDIVGYDKAFHATLNRARELATRGDRENAFNQFVWVQRACVTCHGLAREVGLLEPAGD